MYTDANYAGPHVDHHSTTGYCTFLGRNLITWQSKKQEVVAHLSSEAEYQALAQGICKALWIKHLFAELKISCECPVKQFCDNKATISISHDPVQHHCTKHIEVDHFNKGKLETGRFCALYIPRSRGQIFSVRDYQHYASKTCVAGWDWMISTLQLKTVEVGLTIISLDFSRDILSNVLEQVMDQFISPKHKPI